VEIWSREAEGEQFWAEVEPKIRVMTIMVVNILNNLKFNSFFIKKTAKVTGFLLSKAGVRKA